MKENCSIQSKRLVILLHFIFLVSVVSVVVFMLIKYRRDNLEDAFFTHDAECEYLAVISITESGFTRISIPWSKAYSSYHEELLSFSSNFFTIREHRLYVSRPLTFLIISAVMYNLIGLMGLYILPAAAAIGSIIVGYKIAEYLQNPSTSDSSLLLPTVIPMLAFTTPILFYGLCYWGISLGGYAAASAVCLSLLRQKETMRVIMAGAILAIGVSIRPELIILAVLMIVWLWRLFGRPVALKLTLGIVLVMSINCVSNVAVYGSLIGPHITGNRIPFLFWIRSRLNVFYELFMRSLGPVEVEGIAGVAVLFAFLPSRIRDVGEKWRTIALWAFVISASWVTIATFVYPDPFEGTLKNHSLLACAPFLFLVFFFPSEEGEIVRSLRWLTVGYLLFTALFCPPQAAMAAHWGPRIFMVFMPLMGIVAFFSAIKYIDTYRGILIKIAVLLLIALSTANQIYSLKLLHFKKSQSAIFKSEIASLGTLPVITDQWTVPLDLASFYPKRALWLPKNPNEVSLILQVLKESKQHRILVLFQAGSPLDSFFKTLVEKDVLAVVAQHDIKSRVFHYKRLRALEYRVTSSASQSPP